MSKAKGLALVTGASGGLGLEFARLLAAAGWNLALVARSQDKLEALARDLRAEFGVRADAYVRDLGAPGAADAVFEMVPSCDVLINNAGFASNGAFASLSEERITQELLLDVVTLTLLTRKYLPGMLDRKSGRILNVASTAGFLPGPLMAVYYAAKAYVISFSQALWEETRGTGVTVTCLCPGATRTGFASRAGVEDTPLFKAYQADAASVAKAGYHAMMRGKRMELPGVVGKLTPLATGITPTGVLLRFSRKAVEK
jgi:short-subunit dehydrogenase